VFVTSFLDFDHDPEAGCPSWLEFLNFLTCNDREVIKTLRQWLGSILLPDVRHELFLWLCGVGNNGKSVFADVIQGVLGPRLVSNLTIEQLGGKHELQMLEGKRLNIAMEFSRIPGSIQDSIKRLSSNALITVNPKYKDPYDAKMNTRLMFGSNSVPFVSDRSDAFWRRCLLVMCRAKVDHEHRELGLAKRLIETEAAGIFNWMLEGAVEVMEAGGQIFKAEAINQAVLYQQGMMDPHREFVREMLMVGPDHCFLAGLKDLYSKYNDWMDDRGHKGKLNWPRFREVLEQEFPNIKSVQHRDQIYGKCRGYIGLCWKNDTNFEDIAE
jgi:putative DNA primase/helicase